ncbi:isoprenylcysteine carboxylmethyltransferase family protein [Candidatus Aminicenantes bacterium AC-335-B20]|jgi:protein-S-isoprenylcysteine O-methyltransferase Ste14|nr:isoprenylcysteine carboxylmethyltransferase family protein [SCandidatus Aminicenantes bacterium Aminicenantia_JdfR_composite]MCP2596265.1 isoprenylcysteine carboxylmethyltransferase family protein [Candidatus Aminicenantes bacterium AC-335-G13]MCP2597840.1 isoprenylcysteine carboxylmethyltransferase family protein [Candidatus Aminicenantes bacterium AC-335-L06]MCP2599066.1 isoprenylcysteine carboxylmethyltransferase family protein [Candidatus Aminicenantes bacterium AC-335-B20]MCP2605623.1 i
MGTETLRKKIYRLRVPTGLWFIIAILILAKPTLTSIFIGFIVSIFGFAIRTWAAGHIEKGKNLATSGPYQYIRNPLYFGNFILGLSLCIGANSLWVWIIFVAYFSIFYPVLIIEETNKLREIFHEKYKEYEKKVPCIFPNFKGLQGKNSKRFKFELYKKNKEYRAILGGFIIWMILILKYIFFN